MTQYLLTRIGFIGLVEQTDGSTRKIIFRGTYKDAQQFHKELLKQQHGNRSLVAVPEHT